MGVECDDFYHFDDPRPHRPYPGDYEVRKFDWTRDGYTVTYAGTADECDYFFAELFPEGKRKSVVVDAVPKAEDFEYSH